VDWLPNKFVTRPRVERHAVQVRLPNDSFSKDRKVVINLGPEDEQEAESEETEEEPVEPESEAEVDPHYEDADNAG
jgi:PhoPQ-activated pathogenicity-related protein